ncbi:unnamed protein product [Ostreobium quekettii]|uniref:Uncharacterized protein n=1 Tax=Ostreobium quekettii TaxID=121088 RepID=A0A8S1J172_9CHLO|nr:unnamed protein product [Ostreobium quekettii]
MTHARIQMSLSRRHGCWKLRHRTQRRKASSGPHSAFSEDGLTRTSPVVDKDLRASFDAHDAVDAHNADMPEKSTDQPLPLPPSGKVGNALILQQFSDVVLPSFDALERGCSACWKHHQLHMGPALGSGCVAVCMGSSATSADTAHSSALRYDTALATSCVMPFRDWAIVAWRQRESLTSIAWSCEPS